ncbi:heptosyltransferase-3 [Candidatus Kryptonium thompsonii]|uniref:Heptosyltransferase-3 n=1 Tax=Candidatus Kryptonium thompsonii TaxID=1633631 RepID=A0A0N7MYZ0_9BACT|nr:glycosyltransferase family 9 protein [Candidatus Kryptonium thompsoni]CUS77612.1 heptosyltransferase-3 [Candidatus Kryptonium thompsoni]CUS78565.1 heptosyltransferase-3 [Candidatus Kryptonium thompsoni]CUS85506.1 heptosyltransferase-3 [Candidatus Kryptonium thompsoni]CUS87290.1 heptosyltransferase-3 [Candidatus Kryptonium thompsoni]CUS88465.1 heptosyltransferase-3 [Candidatus Kryptonium thompsoni]
MLNIPKEKISKILVIKLRAIGDVLLSTVVLKNLRHNFPHVKIDFLTEPPSKEIIEGNPYVDELIIFEREKNSLKKFYELRKRKYDLVIDLFCNPRSALLTFITGAKYRVGYAFRGRSYAYNVKLKPRKEVHHNVEFNLDALRALGLEIIDKEIYMPIDENAENFAKKFWNENKLNEKVVVALNPSGTWETKRWRLEKFARLGDEIAKNFKAKILILWGNQNELEDAQKISSMMEIKPIIPPRTNLKQMASILKRCSFMISNDSAPMHIATAVGTPTLGIYGPTNPYAQGPYGEKHLWVRREDLDCIACNLTKCPIGNICMKELSVETVYSAFLKLVEKNKESTGFPF